MTGLEKHRIVLEHLHKLYEAKNADYGDSFVISLKKYGIVSPIIRMSDKLTRLETLAQKNDPQVKESVLDTLLDLANYAVMTAMELVTVESKENGHEKTT